MRGRAENVLALDPDNTDARSYLAAAERCLGASSSNEPVPPRSAPLQPSPTPALPTSFAGGRYQVVKFLGEGGKKKVYLAHDTLLDRDVAFALIKTEGLDDTGRERVTREAQAMGRLGAHPHIVTVFDIGDEPPLEAAHPVSEGDLPTAGRLAWARACRRASGSWFPSASSG